MCSQTHVTGIILAGGYSRRMGRDKAQLPLPGDAQTTFVEHLAALLGLFCHDVVLVARDAEQAAHYQNLSAVRIVTDRVPGAGPLMGLVSGLERIHTSHALAIAVDLPFLRPELIAFLLAQPLDDALLVPLVAEVPQVLLAVYPKILLPIMEERLQSGRRDPRSLLEQVPVRFIDEPQLRQVDPQLRSFINVNTPTDLSVH